MAISGISCPGCCSKEKIHRKRRTGIRYAQVFDDKGIAVGEFRFYHLHCHRCDAMFFIQERKFYEAPEASSEKLIVSEEDFQKASLHRPGTMRIGNTASQYSVLIAAGADTAYAFRHASK
jgi:hypothetical protein